MGNRPHQPYWRLLLSRPPSLPETRAWERGIGTFRMLVRMLSRSSLSLSRDRSVQGKPEYEGEKGSYGTLPTFLIIGAARSGTTSLWNYLKQHPQIYLSPLKHTRFFAHEDLSFRGPGPKDVRKPWSREMGTREIVTDVESYRALFSGVTNETAVGEASHSYLYSPKAPERIRHCLPNARLIAVLRNPIERAYSHYCYLLQNGREPLTDFAQALREEEGRVLDGWWPDFYYTRLGFYYSQLKRYFDLFEPQQIRIYLYEDLDSRTTEVLQDIFRFLEVDDSFTPDVSVRYNAAGSAKSKALQRTLLELSLVRPFVEPFLSERRRKQVLHAASQLKKRNLNKPEISHEVRQYLLETYREDISKLQPLIQRDLSAWLR
jgi:hypothetical protein